LQIDVASGDVLETLIPAAYAVKRSYAFGLVEETGATLKNGEKAGDSGVPNERQSAWFDGLEAAFTEFGLSSTRRRRMCFFGIRKSHPPAAM
jgi:hypothetical protein